MNDVVVLLAALLRPTVKQMRLGRITRKFTPSLQRNLSHNLCRERVRVREWLARQGKICSQPTQFSVKKKNIINYVFWPVDWN